MKEYNINYCGLDITIIQDIDGKFVIPDIVKEMDSIGTALKPSVEPIVLARKPLSEKTVAENCLKWGVGGLNIDGAE